MKKFFKTIFVIILLIFFVFPVFFLPSERINLKSNVEVSLSEIFYKKGFFYELYRPKLPVIVRRKFWSADVIYEEPVIGSVKFSDGEFAITLKGHIINLTKNNKGEIVIAKMDSDGWSEEFSSLFYALKASGILSDVKEFLWYSNNPAFYDKNGILVIMGYGNYNDKILEYEKALRLYKTKESFIGEVDLRYRDEAVIRWRKQ